MALNQPAAAETIEPNAAAAGSRGAAEGHGRQGRPSPAGVFFEIDKVFLGTAGVRPYERKRGDPLYRPLRIYALDSAASRLDGAVAVVNVPYEELSPGPEGSLLEVVDWDSDAGRTYQPVDLNDRGVLINNGRSPSLSDPMFHQQMVYAVCSSTYNVFRTALGRDPSWGFEARPGAARPVLRIRPHAFRGENACYDPEAGELRFGYFNSTEAVQGRNLPGGRVFTCLSHDIVVHEMTHALLDGLRRDFRLPTHPDVLAFHEGFADLVALFLHFSYKEVVKAGIERTRNQPETDRLLLSLAQQFGEATGKDGALRSALTTGGIGSDGHPKKALRYDEADSEEHHELGSVLVAAVMEAFAVVFRRKTKPYYRLARHAPRGSADAELAEILADKVSKLATQFLSVCVRAVDYCPPTDLRFGEYLRALITADFDLVPDDPWAYREALMDAFARRGIHPDPEEVPNLSEDALLWHQPPDNSLEPIEELHFRRLQFAGDPGRAAGREELERQARAVGAYVMRPDYAARFGCALPGDPALEGDEVEPAQIRSVRSLRRIGPSKEVTFDLVAEVVQRRWLRPSGLDRRPKELRGGATVIIGPDGRFRYVIHKKVTDRKRAERARSADPGSASWEERGGRLYLSGTALRELDRRKNAHAH